MSSWRPLRKSLRPLRLKNTISASQRKPKWLQMQHFITQFQSFITEKELFVSDEKVLLAVSGGVDSVVLCHLFFQAKFNFGIAHCNFQLRGEDSDADEQFAKKLAENFRVPFFSTRFETQQFAKTHKLSIQMAARDLRYEWLEKIRQSNDFQWIATAHHLNDSIETFFYNFAKGTGIRGLHGIPLKNRKIIRPLLFSTKQAILDFASAHDIAYREDASNEKDTYARNKIRHHIIPTLKALNPDFERTAAQNLQHIRAAEFLYDFAIAHLRKEIVIESENTLQIDLTKLSNYQTAASTLLFEWLKPYHFNADQIVQMLTAEIGALFYSTTHKLLVDRNLLIIEMISSISPTETFLIPADTHKFESNVAMLTFEYKIGQPNAFPDDLFIVYLDAEKLHFPLTLRHWRAGDVFYPLGLSGNSQKLQDFFSNNKLSRFVKDRVWILESNGAICWVVGYRIDEHFKITPQTKDYFSIQFQKT